MIEQEEVVYIESGKWMQYDSFVEEIDDKTEMSKEQIISKLNKLINEQKIVITHMTGYRYINYDSAVPKYLN
jgi:hypothetical protein